LNTGKINIKLTGMLDDKLDLTNPALHSDLTLIADPGTTLHNAGLILRMQDSNEKTFTYTVVDLTLVGGASQSGIFATGNLRLRRVRMSGFGSVAVSWAPGFNQPGLFEMSESVIANNSGGGLQLEGDIKITNSIIVGNGSTASTLFPGGIALPSPTAANVDIEFTTIADNLAAPAGQYKAGIDCAVSMNVGRSNVMSNNAMSPNCVVDYSLFDVGTLVGMHNKAGIPGFLNRNLNNPSAPDFYRIGGLSSAIDSGDPTSTTNTDIDGVARPQGAGFDMGASEFKP
jgi:hypothetical protein